VLVFAAGQLGLPPDQGSSNCSVCRSGSSSGSSNNSGSFGPPNIVAVVSKLPKLAGRAAASAAASLLNNALLTAADGELHIPRKSVAS
jgi:hypothetical protein